MSRPTFEQLEAKISLSADLSADLQSQPAFIYHVDLGVTLAAIEVDEAKYALDCKEAELQERVRSDAAGAGEKVTETLVAGRVKMHPEYNAEQTAFLLKKKAAGEWKALQSAYASRGHSLRDLVQLATHRGTEHAGGLPDYRAARDAAARSRAQAPALATPVTPSRVVPRAPSSK